MARRDFYSVLAVRRGAEVDDIKKAYRALARQYHPDRNPGDEDAEQRFREITEAYETLRDPVLRDRYDRLGPLYRADGRPPTPEDLSEMVGEALGGLFRKKPPEQGEDLRYTLRIALEDVATGGTRVIEVRRQQQCGRCHGAGADPNGGSQRCDPCDGTGKSPTRRIFRSTCPHCDGTGQVTVKRCVDCNGVGRIDQTETLKVTIPRGVATGQKLKLTGKGNSPRVGDTHGDLFVIISVDDHPLFQRRAADLFVEVPISFQEAALGADVEVPTINGSTTIRVTAGTESGKIFRLAGRGLPALKGGRKGDLHLRMEVEVPTGLDEMAASSLSDFDATLGLDYHPRRQAFAEQLRKRK